MKTRLNKLFYELFKKDDISFETGIVTDLIFRMAKIELSGKTNYNSLGFQFDDENEELSFNLPHLSWEQLEQLFAFFKMPIKQYVTNSPVTLDEHYVLNELVPAFKAYYQQLKDENSPLITYYRIKSKPKLESTAINTLKKYINKALECFLDNTEETEVTPLIVNALSELYGKVDNLSQYPILYKSIIASESQIRHIRLINQNQSAEQTLALISEGIALFTRYNRSASVLAIPAFLKQMEQYLNGIKISSEKCNVIEDTILKLAGAQMGKRGGCKLSVGHDESRVVLKFADMEKTEALKVIEYFQKLGDETASEGYGYGDYGSAAPSVILESVSPSNYRATKPKDDLERHAIEVDGTFFYDKVFPLLKFYINTMNLSDLAPYQEASKECLAEKAAEQAQVINKNAMFQPAKPISDSEVKSESLVV